MREQLFPLRANVPYRMANNERRLFNCIEDIAFNGYDITTGEHTSTKHLSIVDFCIENGFWRNRYGKVVLVMQERDIDTDYPFGVYDCNTSDMECIGTLTKDGHHYRERSFEMGQDLIECVSLVPEQEIENFKYLRERFVCQWYTPVGADFPVAWNTGAHISTTDPNLLAYFPTQKHWDSRVPQKIRAGRYLKKYFPDMHDDEIRQKAAIISGENRTLKVLTHWYDMFVAYRALDLSGVVSSCMTKDKWRPVHPLMVYHESDVVLVVMYEGDEPKARALVNKNTKEFNIIYGQWERMLPMLEAAGYEHGSLNGAKINKLQRYPDNASWDDLKESVDSIRTEDDYKLLMPYIDGHRDHSRDSHNPTRVDTHSNYCRIHEDAEFEANDHDNACLYPETQCVCEMCDEHYNEDDGYYLDHEEISICQWCYNNDTTNVVTGVRVNSSGRTYHTEGRVTDDYARDSCIWIDGADEYFLNTDVANSAGWVYSDYHECWVERDNCVRMPDNDWIDLDEEGIVFEYDDDRGEYVYIHSPRTDNNTRFIASLA